MNTRTIQRIARAGPAALLLFAVVEPAGAQHAPVTAQVEIVQKKGEAQTASAGKLPDASNVVVWLTPADEAGRRVAAQAPVRSVPQLVQKNKSFEPHVVAVQVGSMIDFPNRDPFFHNVFSLFEGKRFDLGLYEAGTTKSARFDRAGVSFLFCNIHPEMSAVVVSVDTPYYALSDRSGHVTIAGVPDGHYQLQVWYERGVAEDLKALGRPVVISGSARSLGTIQVSANPDYKLAHKNKYGQDYVPPPTGSPAYSRP
jgi:plastocyanin